MNSPEAVMPLPGQTSGPQLWQHPDIHEEFSQVIASYVQALRGAGGLPPQPSLDAAALANVVEMSCTTVLRLITAPQASPQWLYFRVGLNSAQDAKPIVSEIGSYLRRFVGNGCARGWWWLVKGDPYGPALRVRVQFAEQAPAAFSKGFEQKLAELGLESRTLAYEPELRLFGGTRGMELAHWHFFADSDFMSCWMASSEPESAYAIPEGLSLALIFRLLKASRLDLFECWDVFDRVESKRSLLRLEPETARGFEVLVQKIMSTAPSDLIQLYQGERAESLKKHFALLDELGEEISKAYFAGALECGIREFLVPIILFHWNRAGYSAATQLGLSAAAAGVLRKISRKGTRDNDTQG
jgi:thiopeptide-type bacteriocin biosynthesis protein